MFTGESFARPLRRAALASFLISLGFLSATAATDDVGRDKPDAASLVRKLYEQEAWFDRAESVLLRVRRETKYSEAARRRDNERPVESGDSFKRRSRDGLAPYTCDELMAWDARRALFRESFQSEGGTLDGLTRVRTWDGTTLKRHSSSLKHNQNSLASEFGDAFSSLSQLTSWGDANSHAFWWLPGDLNERLAEEYLLPEDFEYVGTAEVEGRLCHVVQSRAARQRMYLGVEDNRRYRFEWFALDHRIELRREVGGPGIRDHRAWWKWLDTLDDGQRKQAQRRLAVLMFNPEAVSVRNTFSDYREVASGYWLPFSLVSVLYDPSNGTGEVEWTAEQTIIEAQIDKPIDDSVFQFELVDGAQVYDERYDPPITYAFSKEQSEQNRLGLVEQERERIRAAEEAIEKRLATIKSRVGQSPPELPEKGWLNGEPLDWQVLRGKVVVLHFWETNCRPCEDDVSLLNSWCDEQKDRLVIIGVHPTTTDLEAAQAKMKRVDIQYPVLIDAADKETGGLGQLHAWLGSYWWPNTVVIDPQGKVVLHGSLYDITGHIRELADAGR